MAIKRSIRRMIENEAVYRRRNERMQKDFEALKRMAAEDNQEHMLVDIDVPLYFFCECSDENCRQRLLIQPSEYDDIHRKRDRFVVIGGHEIVAIEKVIYTDPAYVIVEKFIKPPENVSKLQETEINNVDA